jgi:murein DD-endopeptidase MepM/ murein hydrolase activator NlpD
MRRGGWLAPLFLTAAALVSVPSYSQDQSLQVLPANPRQGEPVFVRVTGATEGSASVRWLGTTYPLWADGGVWTGVLPISADTRAGTHELRLTTPGGTASRRIQVAAVTFPVQHLSMAPAKAALYRFPGVEKEERQISAAVRVKSDRTLWSGDWRLPVQGRFSTPFGVRRIRNGRPVGRHRGMDIAAPTGTPVLAPANGRVALAARFKKYGGTVILDHGQGVTSFYIHMSAVTVKKGQTVLKGATIGRVGAEGVATGPHLHWSVYAQGETVQPAVFTRLSRRGVSWP